MIWAQRYKEIWSPPPNLSRWSPKYCVPEPSDSDPGFGIKWVQIQLQLHPSSAMLPGEIDNLSKSVFLIFKIDVISTLRLWQGMSEMTYAESECTALIRRWSPLWLHQHQAPKLQKARLSYQAGAHPAQWRSIAPGLSRCNDHFYFTRRENPALAFVDHSCFPARATASRVTWQERGSGPPSEWHILRDEGFFFYNSKIFRCGESQWRKKKSYTLWSIIKCMGSRWFYLLTNYLLCFLLIQLSPKNKNI